MPVWRNPRPFATIESSTDLARLLGITWDDIDRLANPDHDHYRRWFVKKRSGGKRPISSPEAELAEAQRRIARRMRRAPLHRAALGYRLKTSVRTHASRHLDRAFVIHFDLEDFFHSIGDDRVKSLLRSLGASAGAAAVMSRLLTEPISPAGGRPEGDGPRPRRRVPQGAPSSPILSNLICRPLDHRLARLAAEMGCAYSRYADDLVFSTRDPAFPAPLLVTRVRQNVEAERFRLNNAKTRIMPRSGRQVVAGVVVNGREPRISREDIRRFRAFLHRFERDGDELTWAWMNRATMGDVTEKQPCAYAAGYLAHVLAINPGQALKVMAEHPWLPRRCWDVPRCLALSPTDAWNAERRAVRDRKRGRRGQVRWSRFDSRPGCGWSAEYHREYVIGEDEDIIDN